jgi:hypothetical protein
VVRNFSYNRFWGEIDPKSLNNKVAKGVFLHQFAVYSISRGGFEPKYIPPRWSSLKSFSIQGASTFIFFFKLKEINKFF